MDYMKRATCVNYTAWDLDCPRIVHCHNRQKLEAKFKRAARRKSKKVLTNDIPYDIIKLSKERRTEMNYLDYIETLILGGCDEETACYMADMEFYPEYDADVLVQSERKFQ